MSCKVAKLLRLFLHAYCPSHPVYPCAQTQEALSPPKKIKITLPTTAMFPSLCLLIQFFPVIVVRRWRVCVFVCVCTFLSLQNHRGRGSILTSPVALSPGGAGHAEERRNSRTGSGAGAGAEAAVAKALSLLPLLLDLRPRPGRGGGNSGAGAGTNTGDGKGLSGMASGLGSGDDELEALLGALLAVLRGGSAANREAAIAALGSKVLPRLGGAAAGGREWLGELITDEELLVAAIEDRSQRGAACHQRALGLTYQLLASSPELMSLALEPGCPLLPAVLDALNDSGGGGGCASGDTPLSRASAGGVDGLGSYGRIASGTPKGAGLTGGSGTTPETPRSAPRTPRLSGISGERRGSRGGAAADGETYARSGLAVLRIIGLVRVISRMFPVGFLHFFLSHCATERSVLRFASLLCQNVRVCFIFLFFSNILSSRGRISLRTALPFLLSICNTEK